MGEMELHDPNPKLLGVVVVVAIALSLFFSSLVNFSVCLPHPKLVQIFL